MDLSAIRPWQNHRRLKHTRRRLRVTRHRNIIFLCAFNHDSLNGVRVGEAKVLGPEQHGAVRQMILTAKAAGRRKWIGQEQLRINGSGAHGKGFKADEEFALAVEGANGSCWKTLRNYIKKT